jgi:mannose-1-phosphate guanylyltransferase/phosphomannomutase
MARLCGRPILEYILDLLGSHGVTEASITLQYLPGMIIDHFPDSCHGPVSLAFVQETTPLGTAGSVKNACLPGDDSILVISGDAMCDFDLSAFMADHLKSGAAVTILGKRVGDPREYGLIDADETGKIVGFIEKPSFSQAVSDIANTGIYILSKRALELIPQGSKYDFAKDLFPLLLRRGEVLRCFAGEGYWCDIGDLETYISCQRDMLYGLVRCDIPASGTPDGGSRAAIIPPVYIGRGVRIGDGALIEAGSVLDDGCVVERGARVSGSIVLQGGRISREARLTGALVCAGASVKAGAMLFEGSAAGGGAVIGEGATVAAGIKIWNGKDVEEGATVTEHLKLGAARRRFFDDNGISGQVGIELTPEFCARVGAAAGGLAPGGRLAVGCGGGAGGGVLTQALIAGARSTGCQVIDFGENFLAQFEFCMNFCAIPLGVFLRGDQDAWIRLLEEGLPASRGIERGVETALSRGEFVRAPFDRMGDRVDMSGLESMYRSQLLRLAPGGLDGLTVQARSRNPSVRRMMREILLRLGCDVNSGGITVEISSQGERSRLYDPEEGTLRHHTVLAACALGELERGRDVALPFDSPRTLDARAEAMGRRILRYLRTPADSSDQEARKTAKEQLWSRDALMQTIMLLGDVRRAGSVSALLKQMDYFDVSARTVKTPGNPAALLRAMGEHRAGPVGEGIVLNDVRGIILVKPLKRGRGIRILAESVSAEIARELCDSTEELLLRVMKNSEEEGSPV